MLPQAPSWFKGNPTSKKKGRREEGMEEGTPYKAEIPGSTPDCIHFCVPLSSPWKLE